MFADHATVSRVVDGDTLAIVLNGHAAKVRLIGVDTPEVHESDKLHRDAQRSGHDAATIQALGKHAAEFVKALVHCGDTVRLEYDQQSRDRYGRVLAFVWLADGRLLNEVIICEGYSPAFTRYPFRLDYQDRFRTCAQQAQDTGRGLWKTSDALSPSRVVPTQHTEQRGEIRGNRNSKRYHLPSCPQHDRVSPRNIERFTSEAEAQQAGYRKAGNCP